MKDANWSINGKSVDWHETDTFDMIGAAKNLKNASDTESTG